MSHFVLFLNYIEKEVYFCSGFKMHKFQGHHPVMAFLLAKLQSGAEHDMVKDREHAVCVCLFRPFSFFFQSHKDSIVMPPL
jgi:hypothetical protein